MRNYIRSHLHFVSFNTERDEPKNCSHRHLYIIKSFIFISKVRQHRVETNFIKRYSIRVLRHSNPSFILNLILNKSQRFRGHTTSLTQTRTASSLLWSSSGFEQSILKIWYLHTLKSLPHYLRQRSSVWCRPWRSSGTRRWAGEAWSTWWPRWSGCRSRSRFERTGNTS